MYKIHCLTSGVDLTHNLWLLTLRGELGLSPKAMEGAKRVLDAGTGTGIWAVEYGKELILGIRDLERGACTNCSS